MKTRRTYVMRARAEAAEDKQRRILAAAVALLWEQPVSTITLEGVAAGADVSVQTVLRHFGNRETLIKRASEGLVAEALAERTTPPGDIERAVKTIVDHYEKRGDSVMLRLGQEAWQDDFRRANDYGRKSHRDWVRFVFEPGDDDGLTDLLVVATDVYTWKLLRRDRGLTRRQVEARMLRLVGALMEGKNHG